MLLKDKMVIVSGIGPGLGQELAVLAAAEGAAGVVLAARTARKLDAAEQAIAALGLFFIYALAMGLVLGVIVYSFTYDPAAPGNISASGMSGVVSAFLGAAAIFDKPFDIDDLLHKVEELAPLA